MQSFLFLILIKILYSNHFSNGAKWAHRRKTIQPAFHFTILETYLRVMNEQAAVLVDQIGQKILAESSKRKEGTILNMVPLLTYAALDIIMGR